MADVHSQRKSVQKQAYIDDLFTNDNELDEDKDLIKQYNTAKRERKTIEAHKQLLDNRVALLKQEEIRTLKKIEETRKKALEIYYLKKKNEEKLKKREEEKEQLQKKQEQQQQIRKQQEREHKLLIEKHRNDKVQKAFIIKQQTKHNEVRKMSSQKQSLTTLKQKNQIFRESRDLNRVKERIVMEKREAIREQLGKKLEFEQKLKDGKQKEIEQIETYEMDLLQKLQNTQQMQKTAFEELESALTMTAKEFAEKYLQPKQKEDQNKDLSNFNTDEEGIQKNQDRPHIDESDKDQSSKISIEQINEINEPNIQNDSNKDDNGDQNDNQNQGIKESENKQDEQNNQQSIHDEENNQNQQNNQNEIPNVLDSPKSQEKEDNEQQEEEQ
ncbi:unnamed protein product [Paramecium primaurelia]|uniref:Uncharacterized protein n=1 Tax=Paramecium primaurelia TaxID=5886 RepID=A0A8S1K4X0_PARPR|nr:unnamed protein product [Paramecium primaurelia]